MIANSQMTVQHAAGRSASTMNKTDRDVASNDAKPDFKELLEQGLQSPKGDKVEAAPSNKLASIKRLSSFETHAEFADQPQVINLEAAPLEQNTELAEAAINVELGIGSVEEAAVVVDGNAKIIAAENKSLAPAETVDATEETVRSIVNTLTGKTKLGANNATAAKAFMAIDQHGMTEQASVSVAQAVKSAATKVGNVDGEQIVIAGQTNVTVNNLTFTQKLSSNEARRIGLEPDAQTSVRESLDGLSFKGDGKAELTVDRFADVKNSTRIAVGSEGGKAKNTHQPVGRVEVSGLASMQTATQITGTANDAPPPVKDQVLDRLGPEIRSMQKAETTSAVQASGVAAANRNVISLQLYPIGLGRVQARLTKEGDSVKIELIVESKQTLDMLNADIDALKTSMRALGASENNINIALGKNNNSGSQDAALENGSFSDFENAMTDDRETDGQNNRDLDGDKDGRLATLQPTTGGERVGYDSTRIII
ncbi:flagellar hook-length control protein FliK [Ahrensia sp. 13_GOM-1096m]|uniref:flagellar hook-length control protein FliK n=1 Tax=Ahrensia sp. 13_GOM-1096m TaxID=1380380 RepID=UPI00047AE556|nr:flagellar hook-length control protein FliK [Ahrensia sp. 13_GOM-1096m]